MKLPRLLAGLFVLACASTPAAAQSFGDTSNLPRVYGPGAYPTNDLPFSHRYNYGISPQFYFNGSAKQLWYQDYLDRVDRAERFGYCPPPEPCFSNAPPRKPRCSVGVGCGFFSR